MCSKKSKTIVLFDVDGTLTLPRKDIDPEFKNFLLNSLRGEYSIGLVGGSDLAKISGQMGGMGVLKEFNYVFAENGLVALKYGEVFEKQSFVEFLGEEKLQQFINGCLEYLSKIVIPVKRGTFIEYRTGLINVCPVGRNCSQEERMDFEKYDKEHQIRPKLISFLKEKFPDFPLTYAIGGQISIDVFPVGWDKSYCLRFLEDYDKIYFYGDKCFPGGNDYEIFSHPRVTGFKVDGPDHTKKYLEELLLQS